LELKISVQNSIQAFYKLLYSNFASLQPEALGDFSKVKRRVLTKKSVKRWRNKEEYVNLVKLLNKTLKTESDETNCGSEV